MSNIMELIEAYAAVYADTWQDGGQDWSAARAAVVEAVEKLEKDAARWKFTQENIYSLPYDDHGCGPEFDLSDEAIDAAMEATNGQGT